MAWRLKQSTARRADGSRVNIEQVKRRCARCGVFVRIQKNVGRTWRNDVIRGPKRLPLFFYIRVVVWRRTFFSKLFRTAKTANAFNRFIRPRFPTIITIIIIIVIEMSAVFNKTRIARFSTSVIS